MNNHRPHHRIVVAILALVSLAVSSSFAEGTPVRPGSIPCPHPFTETLHASGNFVNVADMPAGWATHAHQGVGGTAVNTWSAYSFDLRKLAGQCCEITSATLTVTLKALQAGPTGSATSANDLWSIIHGAKGVTTGLEPTTATGSVFGGGAATLGETTTKTVNITNSTVLNSGYLSIFVEDDTEIVSATLVINGCCVNVK